MYSNTLMRDEVMAQNFYPTDNEVSFDSQSKRDALSIPHTIQSDSQQEIIDRNLSCINTGAEVEAKGRGPTRRRIQVACVRCRRRKIKCSGDVGDGQGCASCRSAGEKQCQFLRVNSSVMQTKPVSTGSGWPYPSNDMVSQRLGVYPPSMAPKLGGLPRNSSNHRVPPFPRASDYEVAPDPQNCYGRQTFGIDSTISYDDEHSTSYNVQPSPYVLPSSPQGFMADYCGLGWNSSRSWGANLQGSRVTGETIFSENDTENSFAHSAYSYLFSGQGAQSGDVLGMASTPGSLTSPSQGERTLPSLSGRNTFPVNGPATPTDSVSGLANHNDFKSGNRWIPRSEPRTPMQPTSNMSFSTAKGNRTKLIPSGAQEMVFGFLPIASTPGASPLTSSFGAFTSLEPSAAASADTSDEFRGNSGSRFRTFSRNNNKRILSLTDYSPDTYGYTKERSYRNRSVAGESSCMGTLLNGLPYTRPPDTLPHITGRPGDGFSDYKTADILPTPISALSNPGGL